MYTSYDLNEENRLFFLQIFISATFSDEKTRR